MVDSYITAVQAISWFAFNDFDKIQLLLSDYKNNKNARKDIENQESWTKRGFPRHPDWNTWESLITPEIEEVCSKIDAACNQLLNYLRGKALCMYGIPSGGNGNYAIVEEGFLLRDDIEFDLDNNILWPRKKSAHYIIESRRFSGIAPLECKDLIEFERENPLPKWENLKLKTSDVQNAVQFIAFPWVGKPAKQAVPEAANYYLKNNNPVVKHGWRTNAHKAIKEFEGLKSLSLDVIRKNTKDAFDKWEKDQTENAA